MQAKIQIWSTAHGCIWEDIIQHDNTEKKSHTIHFAEKNWGGRSYNGNGENKKTFHLGADWITAVVPTIGSKVSEWWSGGRGSMKQALEVERIEFLSTFSIYSTIFTSVIWSGENRSVERKVEPLPIRYLIPFENVQTSLIQSIARKKS